LHYAAALAGNPICSSESFHLLLESGAHEHIVDGEGYLADNYRRTPNLLDMEAIKEMNMCWFLFSGLMRILSVVMLLEECLL
uniref:ANK_REP_REGION domain-containing protein n=1 Tax=Gongylonema pulchrum TaxID=637853 RepID=A0A183DGY8_9BILA